MDASEQIRLFQEFLESNYHAALLESIRRGNNFFTIDFTELSKFNPELADAMLEQPDDVIRAAEIAVEQFDLPKQVINFRIRVKNLPQTQSTLVRNIRSKHIGKFLSAQGIVRQKSDVRPQVTNARFECPSCGNVISVLQLEQKFKEPSRCGCGRKGKFRLLSKELIDVQRISLEEAAEDLEGGEQPKRINIFLKEDLVSPLSDKKTNPGSKIIISGVVKEIPMTLKTGSQSTTYDLLLEANYVEPVQEDFYELVISEEEEKIIKELANDPAIVKKLVSSVAPSIYGYDKIKEALILQLVGGVKKTRTDGVTTRGDMHVLLIGDPGAGKSQLLKRMSKVAPKCRYVSGKGVSGAGLTASVLRDEFLGGWTLEAGALPLSNHGFCLTGDTLITLGNGKNQTLEEIHRRFHKAEKLAVLSFDLDNQKLTEKTIKEVSKREAEEIFKLLLEDGTELKITSEHPLLTWDNGLAWKKIKDCTTKDIIYIPLQSPNYKSKSLISEDFSEFLGLIATDGSLSKKKYVIRFYNKDEELIKNYCRLVKKIFKKEPSAYVDKRSGVKQIFFCSKKAHTEIESYGITKGNKCKLNLLKILDLDEKAIKAFLIGIINGDGCFSFKKTGGSLDITCSSKETAVSYHRLFRKLGIVSYLKQISCSGGGVVKKGHYTQHRITITHLEYLKMLNDDRLVKRKHDTLAKILKRKDYGVKVIKVEKLLEKMRKNLKHSNKHLLYKSIRVSTLKKKGVRLATLKKVINLLSSSDYIKSYNEFKKLEKLTTNRFCMLKIKRIEPFGRGTVYNLQVDSENNPNFFADFVCVHNCMIDEIDKMSVEDRSAMHEALEQQTISISKANVQATLRCETTVLAAANPKFGRFDPYEILAKQIDMPPALINRFDLIFAIKDVPDVEKDKLMAKHILALHQNPDVGEVEISTNMLKKYISYARQKCRPILTDSALDKIKDFYIEMRMSGSEEGKVKTVPISPRQLEALVRLAEASAKLRLSDKVMKKDAERAIEILHYCLSQIGIDPETGKIDIDRIASGITASQRGKITIIKDIISDLENKLGKVIPIEDVIVEAENQEVKREESEEVIERLKRSGDIFEPKRGFISKI